MGQDGDEQRWEEVTRRKKRRVCTMLVYIDYMVFVVTLCIHQLEDFSDIA